MIFAGPCWANALAALARGVGREGGRVFGIGLVIGVGVVEVPLGQLAVVGIAEVGVALTGLPARGVAGHGVHVVTVHALVGCRVR